MPDTKLPRIHPGEVIREEWMKPAGWSPQDLASATGLSMGEAIGLMREELPVTPGVARALSMLGVSVQFWLNLQQRYEEAVSFSRVQE